VAPLRLGGLRGKQSTPSVWLGGTGELSRRSARAGAARSAGRGTERGTSSEAGEWQRYDFNIFIFGKFNVIDVLSHYGVLYIRWALRFISLLDLLRVLMFIPVILLVFVFILLQFRWV
jgi:hypothetical protein